MLLYRLLDYSLSPALSRYYTWKRNIFSEEMRRWLALPARYPDGGFYYDADVS